jgi:hypothetical protein
MDPESGLGTLRLDVMEQVGNTVFMQGDPLILDASKAINGGVFCRVATFEHNHRYFSRALISNNAVPPLWNSARSHGFRVDGTPPSDGLVNLRLIFPAGFEKQAVFEWGSVDGLLLRLRLSSFYDFESGIAFKQIRVYATNASAGARRVEIARGSIAFAAKYFDTKPLGTLQNGTVLQAEVEAVNRVGLFGSTSLSPELVLNLGAISVDDPWIANGKDGGKQESDFIEVDMVSVGFSLATDPMNPAAKFKYSWAMTDAPCDDPALSPAASELVPVRANVLWDQEVHRPIEVYTGDMLMPKPGSSSGARDAIWAAMFASPGLVDGSYCVLLEACTEDTYTQNGEVALPSRCKNATSREVTLDTSPPLASTEGLVPVNMSTSPYRPFPMNAPFSCAEEHSSVATILLSIGDSSNDTKFLDIAIDVRTGMNGTFVTTDANVTGLDGVFSIEVPTNQSIVSGAAQVSQQLFGAVGPNIGPIVVSLSCINSLGKQADAQSSSLVMIDILEPIAGAAGFPTLTWYPQELAWYGASDAIDESLAFTWEPFTDQRIAHQSVCISTAANMSLCDVEYFTFDGGDSQSAVISKAARLERVGGDTVSDFAVTLLATDMVGLSTSIDVRLVLDHTPPQIGNLTVVACEGDCNASVSSTTSSFDTLLYDTLFHLVLDASEMFDDDVPEVPTLGWDVRGISARGESVSVSCEYRLLNRSRPANDTTVTHGAFCNVTQTSELCFTATAITMVGLTASSIACRYVSLSAAVWSAAPLLMRAQSGNSTAWALRLNWTAPELDFAVPTVQYALCTHVRCGNATTAQQGQLEAIFPLSAPIFTGYQGEAWVELRASGSVSGLRTSKVSSNSVLVGGTGPTEGLLKLSPSSLGSLSEAILTIDGFVDPVYGISRFVWCVGTALGKTDLMPCVTESSLPRSRTIDFSAYQFNSLDATHSAIVTATACNLVGQCTYGSSNLVIVDVDDPKGGYLADGLLVREETEWADALVLSCDLSWISTPLDTGTCTTSPLLNGDESDALREYKVAPLRAHVIASPNAEKLQRKATGYLSASWGGFSDRSTGLAASATLCFDWSHSTSTASTCANVTTTGMALIAVKMDSDASYTARLSVRDNAGRELLAESAGVAIFTKRPIASSGVSVLSGLTGTANASFTESCTRLQVAFGSFTDEGCESDLTYKWQLCEATGLCTDTVALQNGTNVTAMSVGIDSYAQSLEPGVMYHARVYATGCAGIPALTTSKGILCDPTEPAVIGAPSMVTVDGARRIRADASASAGVAVSWVSVFRDEQSNEGKTEVCFTLGGSACAAAWHQAAVGITSIELMLPDVNLSVSAFRAVVRRTNQAGGVALAVSSPLIVDHEFPTLDTISVDDFGESDLCVLNRLFELTVSWRSSDTGGLWEHEVLVTDLIANLPLVKRTLGPKADTTVVRLNVSNGRSLRFTVIATDRAGQSTSVSLGCLVDTAPPPTGSLYIRGAVLLGSGTYAIDASHPSSHSICWSGFSAGKSPLRDTLLWTTLRGAENFLSLPSSTYVNAASNLSTVMSTNALDTCFPDTTVLTAASYTVRVAGRSMSGLNGTAAEISLLGDVSAPEPRDHPIIHTGSLSEAYQVSACCLRISWLPWSEPETQVKRYILCPAPGTNSTCLDVGLQTHVVIRSPDANAADCICEAPDAGSHWAFYQHSIGTMNATTKAMRFTLAAENSVGMMSDRPMGPYTVHIQHEPPKVAALRFAGRALIPTANLTSYCAAPPGFDALQPAGTALEVRWTPDLGDEDGVQQLLNTYHFCINSVAGASCTTASSSYGVAIISPALQTGPHVLTIRV